MKWKVLFATLALCVLFLGCSDDDETITTPVVDTAPPAIPTGFNCCAEDLVSKLSWEANVVDDDLAGYLIYRTACNQTWQLTPEPITNTRFVDPVPFSGPTLYEISAVDINGNESARALIHVRCSRTDRSMNRD